MRFKIPAKQPSAFKSSALYLAGRTRGQSPDRVAWFESRNLETDDPQVAAAVMDATAARNLRCKQPAYHFVLSFDPKDAKRGKVPPEVMREIADEAVSRLGLREHQMLIYAHKDTDHPHMHFLVNRIHPETGKAFNRHNDGRKLAGLCREIARERGLNIPRDRERIREKERVDDFDLEETLKEQQSTPKRIPEGEYWQARRDQRPPDAAMDKAAIKSLRESVQSHFYNASDWKDLEARLGAQGVYLHRKGQGIVLAKGDAHAKLSQMGKGVRLRDLEERFGERFDAYTARRVQEMAREESLAENIPGYEEMTPAERRRAEKLHTARKAVARKKGDRVQELEAADLDYRYWSGVEANYKATERRVARHERDSAWLRKVESNFDKREQKARESFLQSLGKVFRDSDKAQARWQKLEKAYGIDDARQMIRDNPEILGSMNGRRILGKDSAERRKARQAFRYLDSKRKRWRETLNKLGHHRSRIEENRRALRIAINDFEMMKQRTDVPYALKAIIRDRIQRRERVLSRVTEKAIRESEIADDRKVDLLRARKRYLTRRKDLERSRERGR